MNNVGLDNTIPISGFALLTVPLHLAVPNGRYRDPEPGGPTVEYSPLAGSRGDRIVAGSLYAVIATLINFLNSGMAAHMIGILTGLGVAEIGRTHVCTPVNNADLVYHHLLKK